MIGSPNARGSRPERFDYCRGVLHLSLGSSNLLTGRNHLDFEVVLIGIGSALEDLMEVRCKPLSQLNAVQIQRFIGETPGRTHIEPRYDIFIPIVGIPQI